MPVAILLAEALGGIQMLSKSRVQNSATDIGECALETARAGSYPIAASNDVPRKYLDEYSTIHDGRIEVRQALRAVTLFSEHTIFKDPPFMNVDIVSLHNVLIYLNTSLQERVLNQVHYWLAPQGLLFFGTSEAVGSLGALFETLSGSDKVFIRREAGRTKAFALDDASRSTSKRLSGHRRRPDNATLQQASGEARMFHALARTVAPNGFAVT